MLNASLMAGALRLTRRGDLTAAAALLRGKSAPPAPVYDLTPEPVVPPRRPAEARSTGGKSSFLVHRYKGVTGRLDYKLYLPERSAAGLPLVVMLHGCTQSPDDFARGTAMNAVAEARGFAVAWPGQAQSAHPQKCWNWFRPRDQRRGGGEPATLTGLVAELIAKHGFDRRRVCVAGLSAGGAAAAVLAHQYPDVFAACGIHSGLACGAAHDLPSALQAMRAGGGTAAPPSRPVPTIVFHGDRDTTVASVNATRIVEAASAGQSLHQRSESGRTPGGRRWTRTLSSDAAGRVMVEDWNIAGLGHAWSGGSSDGSYTDPSGPDASAAMAAFFAGHRLPA